MSLLTKLKEFFFGPAVTIPSDRHPLDGATKKAIIQPAPTPETLVVAVPAPAPEPVAPPPAPPAPEPVAEAKVEEPKQPLFEVTPTEWPFPTGLAPQAEVAPAPVKKPRKPRAPKVKASAPAPVVEVKLVPAIKAAPKTKGKKK